MQAHCQKPLAIRWTIGDVSRQGFEALNFSIRGAWRVFGEAATYVVCVNCVGLEEARELAGQVPHEVRWHAATRQQIPKSFRSYLDENMSEGVGWKFAPMRLFPQQYELALDNDCILWQMPAAIRNWRADGADGTCVIAADVRPCFGQFADLCGSAPRNSGIRGLPPGFDLESAFTKILSVHPVLLRSEQDEQGLQVATVSAQRPPHVVTVQEVSICSPFPPHAPHFGSCGAHFVSLNAKRLPWDYYGRPATDWVREHWERLKPELEEQIRAPTPPETNALRTLPIGAETR